MFGVLEFDDTPFNAFLILLFYLFAVLSALILHEIAHGWVAYKCGDPSAKYAGRLSLNPARHLDPLGTLSFILFGFGWANPVPVNPLNFKHPRRGCILVSLAGIVMNLLIAFIASFFFVLLYGVSIWCYLFQYMVVVNVIFATFNILPIAPLDGFNLLAALFPRSGYVKFMRENRLWALIILLIIIYATNVLFYLQNGLIALFVDFWGLIL